jgi:hypothetical protein
MKNKKTEKENCKMQNVWIHGSGAWHRKSVTRHFMACLTAASNFS